MLKSCQKVRTKFLEHFDYLPEAPFEVVMGKKKASEEYCKVLQKCIDDNFDYTIEKYGTRADGHSWKLPDIIWD